MSSAESDEDRLGAAIYVIVSDTDSEPVKRAAYQYAKSVLHAYLKSRWEPILKSDELESVVDDVLMKLMQRGDTAVRRGGGYAMVVARNAAVDAWRRQQVLARSEVLSGTVQELLERRATPDDDVASRFEYMETSKSIARALSRAQSNQDSVAFQVVTTALDETDLAGARPSNRQIAKRLGVSHTAVNNALRRFRGYLEDEGYS